MYSRYAEKLRWKVEVMSLSEADAGGFKEIVAQISGMTGFFPLEI